MCRCCTPGHGADGRCRCAAGHAVCAADVFRHGAGPGGRALHGRRMCHSAHAAGAAAGVPHGGRRGGGLDHGTRGAPGRRRAAEYDVLSLDTGATMDRDRIPARASTACSCGPSNTSCACSRPAAGAGAGACARRGGGGRRRGRCRTGAGPAAPPGRPGRRARPRGPGHRRAAAAGRLSARGDAPRPAALAARRVTVFRDTCAELQPGVLVLGSGARLACDAPVLATGAEPPPWLAGSGLQLDVRGFVLHRPTLQSCRTPRCLPRAMWPAATRRTRAVACTPCAPGRRWLLNLRRFVAGGALQPLHAATAHAEPHLLR
jgi:hypothetical protein